MFESVSDKTALSEKIISQITDALVRGELKPGERLPTERDLAVQFGVSRTVIRDAVKTLAGRGILHVRHGAGIFIAATEEGSGGLSGLLPLEGSGLKDLFGVRRVLEVEGAGWAAEERTEHHVERLRSILENASQHTNEPEVLSERDAQFHVAIAEASRNLVLVRVMLTLLDLLAKARLETLSITGRPELSLEQHGRIVEAIESGEAAAAREAMQRHLDSVEAAVLSPRSEREEPAG